MEEKILERVAELDAEIEAYRETIRHAEGALDSAEKELNEVLSELTLEDFEQPD